MAVLVVDDDESILVAVRLMLKAEGLACEVCRRPAEALERVRARECDVALVDLNYERDTTSGQEGLELIRALRAADRELPIVAMTGWGSIGVAVEAMQCGAADFVEKPWRDNRRLLATLRTQIQLRESRRRERRLQAENALLRARNDPEAMIQHSPAMQQLLSMARRVAASAMPVLITGENGTGKSLLAGYIHAHSSCASGPFISVNMGAVSEGTFESEMFGHTRGAFTDAKKDRIGRVELAENGTLFMDEIANMPLSQQAKILRLLEERRYEKLGSSQSIVAAVRFVSATNADLDALIAERGFRVDLLYRLNGVTLRIPPLRERAEDILPLAERFLSQAAQRYSSPARALSAQAARAISRYPWPGNVRELQHVIERAALLASRPEVQEADLQLSSQPAVARAAAREDPALQLTEMTLEEAEIWLVQHAMQRSQGNPVDAARSLGISRSALYRRLGKRSAD